jgi:hypothetical protein
LKHREYLYSKKIARKAMALQRWTKQPTPPLINEFPSKDHNILVFPGNLASPMFEQRLKLYWWNEEVTELSIIVVTLDFMFIHIQLFFIDNPKNTPSLLFSSQHCWN